MRLLLCLRDLNLFNGSLGLIITGEDGDEASWKAVLEQVYHSFVGVVPGCLGGEASKYGNVRVGVLALHFEDL